MIKSGQGRAAAYFDTAQVDAALHDVHRRIKVMAPALRQIAPLMRKDQKDHREKQEGPDGPWTPRSKATLDTYRRKRRRARVSRATKIVTIVKMKRRSFPRATLGRLPRAIRTSFGRLSVTVESRAKRIGNAHQGGAMVGRGRRVRLPSRVFLWLSDDALEKTSQTIAFHVVRSWPGMKYKILK